MCLYPRLIKNRKYTPNKKNNGVIPECTDSRVLYVAVGCGYCIECRKQKARAWQVRLLEEIKNKEYSNRYFITLTFSEESYKELEKLVITKDKNEIAAIAIRRFLERWRKKHKKSLRHWLITELGHEGTKRLHIHGVIFTNEILDNEKLKKYWQYGICDTGQYVNERTINYIMKYVTKVDKENRKYIPQIFCSSGIGSNFCNNNFYKEQYKYRPKKSKEYYITKNGNKINLPIYYRNKFYNEEEREKLWTDRLDKNTIYVLGTPIVINKNEDYEKYLRVLAEARRDNVKAGYGTEEWKEETYKKTYRELNQIEKYKKFISAPT